MVYFCKIFHQILLENMYFLPWLRNVAMVSVMYHIKWHSHIQNYDKNGALVDFRAQSVTDEA